MVRGRPQPPIQGSLHEPRDAAVDRRLQAEAGALHGMGGRLPGTGQVGQVARQDQQRFDQRDQQHAGQDDRHRAHQVTERARNEEQRGEGRHRREDREDQGPRDPPHAPDRGSRTRRTACALPVDALGHHDGVVDDDAGREEEREDRHRVQRRAGGQHHGQGADPGHDHPQGDPERESERQEQRQREKNQQQPQGTVLEQHLEPFPVGLRIVVPDGDPRARGQRRAPLAVEELPHRPRHVQQVLVRGPEDLDERRRPALVAHYQVRGLEAVAHLGDVAQTHDRAVASAQDDERLEVLLVVAPAGGADADLRVAGLDAPRRQVERAAPHRVRHVLEGEAQRMQPPEGHLDGDLVGSYAAGLDAGDLGQGRDRVLGAVRQLLQRALGDVAVEHEAEGALAARHLVDLRTFGLRGEGPDAADRRLDVGERPVDVRARLQLDRDGRQALRRHRGDLLHVVDTVDLLLDPDDDGLLDLARRGAGIAHRDFDQVEGDLGKRLLRQTGQRHQPRRHDEQQEEVGGDAATYHVGDGTARFVPGAGLANHRRLPVVTHLTGGIARPAAAAA